jgi:hypothetical protein
MLLSNLDSPTFKRRGGKQYKPDDNIHIGTSFFGNVCLFLFCI